MTDNTFLLTCIFVERNKMGTCEEEKGEHEREESVKLAKVACLGTKQGFFLHI